MFLLMKCLNEEKSVKRVMDDIHDELFIDRIIVIDGGSTDYTKHELRKYKKVSVFHHFWDKDYHDMEIVQSNIALSYIPHGEICFILDFDERCSASLKLELANINKRGMPNDVDCVSFSRKSYECMRHKNSTYAIIGGDGWPILSNQIGQYPDYQLRLIRRKVGMHWINSPHHVLFGVNQGLFRNESIMADIIHYHGKDDVRDRFNIEMQWARVQARRKELGLLHDMFECRVSQDLHEFTNPDTWRY